jgi:hypothetical protein
MWLGLSYEIVVTGKDEWIGATEVTFLRLRCASISWADFPSSTGYKKAYSLLFVFFIPTSQI